MTRRTVTLKETVSGEGGDASPTQSQDSITLATSVPKTEARSRGCVWTLYNYEAHLEGLKVYAQDKCTYAVWGYETCPKTGRPHLQGYSHWENPRSLMAFSKKFGKCHVEVPIGSPRQNREYCLKIRSKDPTPNEKFEEYGELPVQGHRTDWERAVADVRFGIDITEIIESQPQLVQNQRALREYRSALLRPLHREVNVIVIYGGAGTGKTRWAYENHPNLYSKPPNKTSGSWWNGYDGEKTILLDDYYGGIMYCEFLRVLDRYPYSAPICGGGYIQAQWDTIIITSNKHPKNWYTNGLTPALRRRINKIIHATSIDGTTHYEEEGLPEEEDYPPPSEDGAA